MKRIVLRATLSLLGLVSGVACSSDPAAPTQTMAVAGETMSAVGTTGMGPTSSTTGAAATSTTGSVGSSGSMSSAVTSSVSASATSTGTTTTTTPSTTTLGVTNTSNGTTGIGTATTAASASTSGTTATSTMGGAGGTGSTGTTGTESTTGGDAEFALTSPGLDSGPECSAEMRDSCALFDVDNTSYGDDVSPAFSWSAGPAGTQSYAIVMQDLAFLQQGEPFAHWMLWNIPASVTSLPEELEGGQTPSEPAGASQISYKQDDSFAGSGACGNVYEFVLLALSVPSVSIASTDPDTVRDALLGSADILDSATLRARSDPNVCN